MYALVERLRSFLFWPQPVLSAEVMFGIVDSGGSDVRMFVYGRPKCLVIVILLFLMVNHVPWVGSCTMARAFGVFNSTRVGYSTSIGDDWGRHWGFLGGFLWI